MLLLSLILITLSITILICAFLPGLSELRPQPKIQNFGQTPDFFGKKKKQEGNDFIKGLALLNRPLIGGEMRLRLVRDLSIAQLNMSPEEFMLIKEIMIVVLLIFVPGFLPGDMLIFAVLMSVAFGYFAPEFWLKGKIKKVKEDFVRYLPDTVDLLGLCVNAGLDFMMALKWVSEKSSPNVVVNEMNSLLQEISVGKPRREALRDAARKYELADLSTFSRTLIQADKMGTSVSEALNILSEDMRQARYRRGEAMALKAPIKLLVPLLFCIFPVVGILVGGPIFLDFMTNNPMKKMGM